MPKDFTAPSQNWNVQDQLNQSLAYQKQQEQNAIKQLQQEQDFNALAAKEQKAWDKLKKYEADGYDMSMHYDKFKTIGAKDNQFDRAYKGFRKFTSEGAITLSNAFGVDDSQYRNNLNQIRISENNWKQNQADTKPNKYDSKDDVWNVSGGLGEAAPYVAGGIAMGVSKAPTLGGKLLGDIGRGAVADAYLGTLQHGYKDNFDEQLAKEVGIGVAGQAVGTGIAHLLSKIGGNAKLPTDIQPTVKPQEPTINTTNSDDIAAKINQTYFGGTQPEVAKVNIPEANNGINSQQVNDFFNPVNKNRVQAQGNKNLPTPASQQDPFVYNPNKPVDTFGFASDAQRNSEIAQLKQKIDPLNKIVEENQYKANMNVEKKDYSPYILDNQAAKPMSKLPDVLPLGNREEMKSIIRYAKDNDAVDEFISKLPQNARVDEVQKFFDNLKPTQIKEDGIIPVTTNKKEPIKNYNIPSLQEFEGLTKATGNNTADVLSLSTPTSTSGVRNAIDRYISGTASQRDIEILDAVENFMKYEGDNFRQKVGVSKPDTSMKIDDAIRNNIDYKTADVNGAIPFSNGTQTFGGASVGGLESEFNQRDYNNDGKHDYKDNIYGVIVGALGINAAKKLFPKAFKDDNLNNDVVAGMLYPKGKPNFKTNGNPKTIVDVTENVRLNAGISNKEVIADAIALKDKHPEFFKTVADVDRHIKKVVDNPNYYFKGTNPDNKLLAKEFNGKLNKVAIEKDGSDYNKLIHATKSSKVNKEINRLLNLEKKDSLERSPTLSLHNGQGNGADALSNYPISDKSISNNIPKSQDERTSNFLRKARERIQAKIDSGEIPEKGRTVISPYDKGKEYYLGESGKVYFKRGNGTWRETPNEETIKDVKYVATNGLSAFKKMRGEKNLRFEKALEESKKLEEARNSTYKMDHKAPNKENGVSAYDITDMFSKDIYSKDAARLFGHGSTKMDNESISLINKVRNKPEAEVTIYRAVPKDLDVNINPDDWVTTSKEYAKVHGEGPLKGNYKILEMKVKAKDLYTDGNSIHEWGWSPNATPDGMIAMSSPTLSGTLVGGVTGAISDLDGDGKITYKDIAIGALGGAGLTKGALLARNTNIVDKAKNIIKNIADTETADKIIGHKIYQKTDYMDLREAMIVGKNKQMESFALLHEQLKLLDDATRTKMYDYMSGDRSIQLDTNIKQLADNYTNEIDRMGKELVDLGVLEEAQFDKFKGRYLHRRYEKDLSQKFNSLFTKGKTVQGVYARGNEWTGTKTEYEQLLNDGKIGDFFQGKIEATRMNNGQYKFRQDWTDEQRARWGEIKDIAFSLPETLMRTREMIDHAKMLKNIVDNTGYVSNDALEGYVQLSGKRYGALNGKYVPSDIASDIKEFGDALFGSEGKLLSSKGMEAFKALSTFWKKSHTVYNPIAHLNNLLSNVTMQFGAGINPNKAVINATKGAMASQKVNQFRELTAKKIIGLTAEENAALRALSQDEDLKLWNQAQQAGLFGRSNLNDILNKYINPTNAQVSSNKFKNAFQKVDEATSSWYQGEDNIMRFSMLKSLTESGISFDDAIKQINNTIPDYTKPMSQWARFGRDSMLTPFISWTYYATPIILKQMKDKPERIAAIYGALYGMNQLMGIDPFNEKDIPQQNFSMKRIPIYKNGNEVTTIKVDRWIPHNDILNPLDFIKNLTSGGAWTPISDIPRNRNSYFGGKITHNEGALKAYDLGKYAVQQITPDALDNIYNLIESKIMSEKKRTKNPVIQPRTTTEELLKNFGINIMTYNKANQAKKIANEKIK